MPLNVMFDTDTGSFVSRATASEIMCPLAVVMSTTSVLPTRRAGLTFAAGSSAARTAVIGWRSISICRSLALPPGRLVPSAPTV
jgi:hypothetical protein